MENAEIIAAFARFKHHNQGRSERTAQAYTDALERLCVFLEGRSLLDATEEELALFTGTWLHKQGVVAESRRPYIAAVRELYRWLTHTRKIQANAAAGLSYPRTGKKLPVMISLGNAERLMGAPDFSTFIGVRDSAILAVILGCGFRVAGVVRLNESNLMHVQHDGETRLVIKVKEKGDKERIVPVPKETAMLLQIYLEHDELKLIDRALPDGDRVLFVSVQNPRVPLHEYHGDRRRISTRGVRKMMKKYGEKVGVPIDQLHPHAGRHLFGTELAESDVDLIIRQDLLGHADPKHTKLYDHMAMRRKIEAMDKANPMAKMRTSVGELLRQLNRTQPKQP